MTACIKLFYNFSLILFVFAPLSGLADTYVFHTQKHRVKVEQLVEGLKHPWALAFLPGGSILITEREGYLNILSPDGELRKVKGLPDIWVAGQGGLLDIAVDPEYPENKRIFFSFSEPSADMMRAGTSVISAKLIIEPQPELRELKVIFAQNKKTRGGRHFGSRIVLPPNGTMFISVGDRGQKSRAQDPFDHAGSIISISRNGTIPEINPFKEGKRALPEIWSIGHRNPQGLAWVQATNSIWAVSHGAQGGDEINRVLPGKNYGWPVISYGKDYSGRKIGEGTEKIGLEQPIFYWDPSIAPSGLAYYEGNVFPRWTGNLFVGALKLELLARLEVIKGKVVSEERLFTGRFGRIRDVRQGLDGYLYFLTDENPGQLLKITPMEN